jgi:hypothetical protein
MQNCSVPLPNRGQNMAGPSLMQPPLPEPMGEQKAGSETVELLFVYYKLVPGQNLYVLNIKLTWVFIWKNVCTHMVKLYENMIQHRQKHGHTSSKNMVTHRQKTESTIITMQIYIYIYIYIYMWRNNSIKMRVNKSDGRHETCDDTCGEYVGEICGEQVRSKFDLNQTKFFNMFTELFAASACRICRRMCSPHASPHVSTTCATACFKSA